MIGVTLLLTFMLCCSATYVGAYAIPGTSNTLLMGKTTIKTGDGSTGTPPSVTSSTMSSTDPVKVAFHGITITGEGPLGVELVKSRNTNVSFELLNLEHEENLTTKADIINGVMQISVQHEAPNGLTVDFGPDYQNVVRIHIPDAVYTSFDIQSKNMVVRMQDFHAPVHATSTRAGFRLMDTTISQGTYDIEIASGSLDIEADSILSNITATVNRGMLTMRLHQDPTNLYVDSKQCGPVVERPDHWPALYRVGNGTPKILLHNTSGKTIIEVQRGQSSDITYTPDANKTITIPVSIEKIDAGDFVCMGQIPFIQHAKSRTYTLQCTDGTGIFVGMAYVDKHTSPEPGWYNYAENSSNTPHALYAYSESFGCDGSNLANMYLYIGSAGTDLTHIRGTITIQY